jgi:hypothetical protein
MSGAGRTGTVAAASSGTAPTRGHCPQGQLHVKGTEHALACQLEAAQAPGRDRPPGVPPRMTIASLWVLESRWVTSQRIPALSHRIAMTCSAALEPAI